MVFNLQCSSLNFTIFHWKLIKSFFIQKYKVSGAKEITCEYIRISCPIYLVTHGKVTNLIQSQLSVNFASFSCQIMSWMANWKGKAFAEKKEETIKTKPGRKKLTKIKQQSENEKKGKMLSFHWTRSGNCVKIIE